jgi:hypothetical protein
MDLNRCDHLARVVAPPDSRRLLRTLPISGGVPRRPAAGRRSGQGASPASQAAHAAAQVTSKRRTQRRKAAAKRRKQRQRPDPVESGRPQACTSEPRDELCAGKCGERRDRCGGVADCGLCDTPPGTLCATLKTQQVYDVPPQYDCAAGLVCDCGQYEYNGYPSLIACARPEVCRPNHAPVAIV